MNKILSTKNTISLFLAFILVTGTIALSFPSSFMINAQAQPSYNNNYKSKDTNININKIKCINDNLNINGVNSGDVNADNKGIKEGNLGAYSSNNGEGYYNDKKTFDCAVSNTNTNTNIISTGSGGANDNQTIPPEPPTPASLTVKKQVFGCDNIITTHPHRPMDCQDLQNNSSAPWLDCNTSPAISSTVYCLSLPESIFDIEVLDDQNNQIQQFEGSVQGTTIQNLEPGTYTVNEIKYLRNVDQLAENQGTEEACVIGNGFPDGGILFNLTAFVNYEICFEYEDEQGNDCSTITLTAGDERTCTVKNYIRYAEDI